MANENEVIMTIKVEDSTAKKKLKEIKKEAQETGEEVEKQGRGLSENMFFFLSNMNMLFSGASRIVGYLGDKLQSATNKAEQLGSTRFFTGLSSGHLQKIKAQIESVGGSFDSFLGTYSKFNQMWSTRRFRAWDSATWQAYRMLGVDPQSATSSLDLLGKVIDKLSKMQNVGLRNDIAGTLGVPQDLLLAYLKGGRPANRNLFFTDEEVKNAEKINNSIRQMQQESELIQDKLSAKFLMPLYEIFVGEKNKFWKWLGDFTGATVSDDLYKPRSEILMSALKKSGMTEAGAMGVLGNLAVESGLNPLAYNEKEGAFGIAQWRGERLKNLKKYASANKEDYKDFSVQVAFLLQELMSGDTGRNPQQYKELSRLLATTNSAGKAAAMFDEIYERSSGEARAKRIAIANGEDASRYLSNYSTSYSSSSNVTTNNINMVINGSDSSTPVAVENAIKKALASN